MQASSERSDTVARVRKLLEHPAFDIQVPNKIYALLLGFAGNNKAFHSIDGSGYDLYTDFILKIDAINPQVAALLINRFDNWRKFEPNRRALLEKSLLRIQQQPKLSDNAKEIVNKILANPVG